MELLGAYLYIRNNSWNVAEYGVPNIENLEKNRFNTIITAFVGNHRTKSQVAQLFIEIKNLESNEIYKEKSINIIGIQSENELSYGKYYNVQITKYDQYGFVFEITINEE